MRSVEITNMKGSLNILAGRPEVGSTSMLLQLLNYIANEKNGKALYISFDLFWQDIDLRMNMMQITEENIIRIGEQNISKDKFERVIIDNSDVVAIGIDYLQLLYSPTELDDGCRFLKKLAEGKGIPIIVNSQICRCAEDHNNGGRPLLEDLVKTGIDSTLFEYIGLLWRKHECDRSIGYAFAYNYQPESELSIYKNQKCIDTLSLVFDDISLLFSRNSK